MSFLTFAEWVQRNTIFFKKVNFLRFHRGKLIFQQLDLWVTGSVRCIHQIQETPQEQHDLSCVREYFGIDIRAWQTFNLICNLSDFPFSFKLIQPRILVITVNDRLILFEIPLCRVLGLGFISLCSHLPYCRNETRKRQPTTKEHQEQHEGAPQ